MDAETRFAYRVGIVVICAAIILAILIMIFGEGWKSQYTITVRTATAPNVTKNTPVRRNGIRIGRVASVKNKERFVELTLKIDSGESIFANEVCEIGTASLLGDAVIDFMPGRDPTPGAALPDNGEVNADKVVIERSPVEMIDVVIDLETQVQTTLKTIQSASESVDNAAKKADEIIGGLQNAISNEGGSIQEFLEKARNLSATAEILLGNGNVFFENINDIVGDPVVKQGLSEAVINFGSLLETTAYTVESFKDVSAVAKENLDNITSFTSALGEQGPRAIEKIQNSLDDISSLLAEIGTIANGENSQGTIGKLLNDPELYNNLNDTARNARDISSQLMPIIIQLQPLMNDVRYAVDGIARDPGQLGVRGALNRGQPFGQFKGTIAPKPQFR